MNVKCDDCKTSLRWKGKGRKPKRCEPCRLKHQRNSRRYRAHRDSRHKKNQPASKWGDLWLVDGKAIKRDKHQVWGATGDNDDTVVSRSGVFHKIGAEGLPDEGVSTSDRELQGILAWRYLDSRELEAAKAWLKDHPDWWRIEEFAHDNMYADVTDSVCVHAGELVDQPDETSPVDRCTWCGVRRPLELAEEFCRESCFIDYVKTFGACGLELT